ncbi:MAG: 3-oxoacyl-[acyl-carrier-protein] reductase [Calditrichia bacterium]
MEIKNKVALVTGSSHRVGKTIALTLATSGARVAVHYHSQKEPAEKTLQEIRVLGGEAILLKGDISQRADWIAMRDTLLETWGKIDILVNNAAIFYKTPVFDITDQDWQNFLDINLKGTFLGCQIIGKTMVEAKSGKIINIADVSAEKVWAEYIPYCISKAGVIALTKGMAKALAPHVVVNAISPGTVLFAESYVPEEEEALIRRTPLKRIGSPQDIANAVVFLIEGSDFITGAVLNVDGGRSLT